MVVRRDSRRRRVMLDEVSRQPVASPPVDEPAVEPAAPMETRVDAPAAWPNRVRSRGQVRTTDLIPKRPLGYLTVVGVLLFGLVGVNALAHLAGGWSAVIGDAGVRALALSGPGSLGNWCLSFLFIVGALTCLQVFALRRYRRDDYRGTYRIWLWFAAVLLVASIGTVVPLSEIVSNILRVAVRPEYVDNVLLLFTVKMVILAVLVVRGFFEIRASWGTVGLLAGAGMAFAASACLELPALANSTSIDAELSQGNLMLVGGGLLFLALLTFARYVYLHASGLVRVAAPAVAARKKSAVKRKADSPSGSSSRKSKKKRVAAPAAEDAAEESRTSQEPTAGKATASQPSRSATPTRKKKKGSKGAAAATEGEKGATDPGSRADELKKLVAEASSKTAKGEESGGPVAIRMEDVLEQEGEETGARKLSRAERKRLRKLQKQHRNAA